MTQSAALPTMQLSRFGWRDLGLWAGAATLILGAHVAVAYAVQTFSMVNEADGGPPPAQVIEMAPMTVMPAVEEEVAALDAVMPDQSEPTPTPTTEPTPEQVEKAEPVTEQPEAVAPDETEPTQTEKTEQVDQPPLDEVVPDIVEAVAPDVVIPLPQAKPVETPKQKKPVEAKAKKPVDKPKPKKEKTAPPKTVTAASADAKPAAKTAAPKSAEATGRSGDSSKWDSKLRSWINRHTRYPSAARARRVEGSAYVTFTVDSSGRVLAARLTRSSGNADLDRAALSVLQGATVPAPPPELGGRQSRTAPFVFNLRN
ncbi:energy transducer TonB [Mesorhizobium sp. B2-1-3A]|uniref:energy transducer TonB family protein n=1 Tax=Mesorhizobium sp. B2-1-3A TaxID=2589971 RepID=UPI001125FA72|nr:energy transducer TonB [Mesorhizobium sp. B2-1-3A]TPM91323.1 energy transducer TonB [Mesorhizobium sp. B2-1-3A]